MFGSHEGRCYKPCRVATGVCRVMGVNMGKTLGPDTRLLLYQDPKAGMGQSSSLHEGGKEMLSSSKENSI